MEQARIELELEKQSVLRGCGAVLHAAGSDVSKWTRAVNLDDNQRDSGLATDNEQMQTPTSSTSSSSNGGVEGYVRVCVCVLTIIIVYLQSFTKSHNISTSFITSGTIEFPIGNVK
jgi:hypothetical protein